MSLLNTYNHLPLKIKNVSGTYITDTSDRVFLDTFSGLGVNILGGIHPELVETLLETATRYMHVSNYFRTSEAERLAEKLTELTGKKAVFFANSGTEATEAAIKLCRKYWSGKRSSYVTIEGNFHGRTLGSLSMCTKKRIRHGFDPLFPVKVIERGCTQGCIDDDTAAVFVEPLQGEGGVRPVSSDFMEKLVELKKQHGFLIIFDEIQSGMYRTGSFLAGDRWKDHADIVTLGKGLGGGLPLSACLATEELSKVFNPGDHGSTFGGHPAACALGMKTIEIIEREGFPEQIKSLSKYFMQRLRDISEGDKRVLQVRGSGFMIGVELMDQVLAGRLKKYFYDRNIILNTTSGNVWRLLPSYIMNKNDINRICACFEQFLTETISKKNKEREVSNG